MISIGMFSKMNKVTVKTLRYYDEIGLLKPAYVDEFTGYRYYSTEQLVLMNKILSLKQLSFSLQEMVEVLKGQVEVVDVLMKKQEEVQERLKEDKEMLERIENHIKLINGEMKMEQYDVIIKELPEVIVASMRRTIPNYDALFTIVPQQMAPEMKRVGCKTIFPEYCFNIYHDGEYKETNIDVEICEAVTEIKDDTDLLTFKKINAVSAACTLHKGSYSTIGKAYTQLIKWIEKNGFEIVGSPRESYIDGIWNKDSEADWLTEIQIPIRK